MVWRSMNDVLEAESRRTTDEEARLRPFAGGLGEALVACGECGRYFTTDRGLLQHQRRMHP
jgi:hypothetical protein